MYVGTGSEAIRSNVILGRGMYKSMDAGRTWQHVGLKDVLGVELYNQISESLPSES